MSLTNLKNEDQLNSELDSINTKLLSLNELRIRLEEQIKQTQEEKTLLEKELLEEFGTIEPNSLKQILQQRTVENNLAVEKFEKEVNDFEIQLNLISQELAKIRN